MYIVHVHLGSGCNSYQGHVNDSGEFWRVLGCTHIRHHWKRNIVDTFTHHFCTNRHGWTIGTSFPYIRKSERQHSSPVQYTCISSCLSWLYFALQALLPLKPFTRWETSLLCCTLCCTTIHFKEEKCHECDKATYSWLWLKTGCHRSTLTTLNIWPWFYWSSLWRKGKLGIATSPVKKEHTVQLIWVWSSEWAPSDLRTVAPPEFWG